MKTKLIKLSDQHYVVVDDSEIKQHKPFFNSPKELNEYTANVIKETLETTFELNLQKA